MQHISYTPSVAAHLRAHRLIALAALLAIFATAGVVLVLTVREGASTSSVSRQSVPAARADGGPAESGVAAAVGSRPTTGPDESQSAAAIGGSSPQVSSGPSESRIAPAVAGSPFPSPDQSRGADAFHHR